MERLPGLVLSSDLDVQERAHTAQLVVSMLRDHQKASGQSSNSQSEVVPSSPKPDVESERPP